MGWVDLDLNLPPPPPDPDGDTPLPSPAVDAERDPGTGSHVEADQIARVDDSSGAPGGAIESNVQAAARTKFRVGENDDDDDGGGGASLADGDCDAEAVAPPEIRVCDVGVDAGRDFVEMAVSDEGGLGKRDVRVEMAEFTSRAETAVESEEDEIGVVSRVIRARIEVPDVELASGSGPGPGPSLGRENVAEDGIEAQKPVRKRLRTLGQLRNQKNERIATPVVSPDRDKPSPSSSGVTAATSKVEEEDGRDSKSMSIMERKLDRSSSVLVVGEGSKGESLTQQDEKMHVDAEDLSPKKKGVSVKDAISDKRRRSIVVLGGEAETPPKRPRLPRHPLKKTRSFGGVIVGENSDGGPKSAGKGSMLESPQSSESGQIPQTSVVGKDGRYHSETAVTRSKELKRPTLKEEVSVEDINRDVEMPQQIDNGAELAEGSGVSEEKQGEKGRDVGIGVTVPRRPRKMKEIPIPPSRAPRSTKPPTPIKSTEFIRPTVKKPSVTTPLRRSNSTAGTSSRNDARPAFQDTTIERLQREATCGKLWQSPGNTELQKVPGSFPSVEDYATVLEPLLFEECRAQLHNNWEELLEGTSGDPHPAVIIKMHERRERGWYDVVLMPMDRNRELRFKEGDVAVLSTPKPGSGVKRKGRLKDSKPESAEEGQIAGRVAGIVRRYVPIDVRDPPGAVLRFHVSQEDLNKQSGGETESITNAYHTLQQIQQGGVSWYLTVIGGFTTIQREYSALHQLPNFRPQMMNAILQPRPELFPGYDETSPPPMPDCFTAPFIHHLHNGFNVPQLAAIQWAAAHTAAGTTEVSSNSSSGGQPWPFTLVQGPPGTGKTHTVWGMLNVIHLVQYQRYYAALLKKLAPGSVSSDEYSLNNGGDYYGDGGTIDEVLQKMDQNLARVLPKLCPKPRMLVCAPSNAATDELLSRVLDRGFIDGEMKQYRPDVARVGVDTASRAAQAVSVERRTEQLLAMDQTQVVRWLQSLRTKEYTLGQTVVSLQKDLIDAAATARSQGNVGVDPEVLASRDQMRDGKLQQLAAVVEERDKVLVEMSRLFIIEVKFRPGSNFRIEEARRKLEASFANEAEIVFTTVSSSGRKIFSQLAHGFDMVVIDEAAQASEVAVLPPLSLRAGRCVLVGDPQQLPATVISRAADTMKYSRSLFERFQQAGCPAILLSVQYRMHPQIRDFPSRYFYSGRLVDSESVKGLKEEVYYKDPLLQPYLFFDISLGRESHAGSVSYQNKMEAQVAVHLYQHLLKTVAEDAGGGPPGHVSVGIITPYKQQLQCLEKEFIGVVGSNAASKGVYINTVDAFQGQERDVIMMSCVRASSHGVGFVADIRRMNVALTRARRSLWVIGNASALTQSEDWAALLADAKNRGCFVSSTTCIQRGLLPEPAVGPSGAPLGSPGLMQPRPGGPTGRGRGIGASHGGRHPSSGRYNSHVGGEGSHRRGRPNGAGPPERGPDGRELWQRTPFDRSCRGQRDGPRPPGFGPQFQHPSRRNKGL